MMEALRIISGSSEIAAMWAVLLLAVVLVVLGLRRMRLTDDEQKFEREEKRASRALTTIDHE